MTQQRQSPKDGDPEVLTSAMDLAACVDSLVDAVTKGIAQEVQPYNLSVVEYTLLKTCMDREETTATDLAEILPVDASRISRLVNGLVEEGLLIRRRLSDDRRIVMLRLSDKGRELTSALRQRIAAYEAKLTGDIGDEDLATFHGVVHNILANHAAMKLQP